MRQRLGFWSKLVIIFLILAAVFMFFRLNRPVVVLLRDTSFELAYPEEGLKDLKKALAKERHGFKVVTLDSEMIMDGNALENLASKYSENALVLTSPVVSSAVRVAQINLSEIIKGLAVGMTSDPDGFFDIVLPANLDNLPDGTYYVDAIGQKDVTNLVYPDLALSVVPLLKMDKENLAINEGVMVYGVR